MMRMDQPRSASTHSLVDSVESVALDSIVPHPDNPRVGDVGVIARSLRAHGQYRPLVVQAGTRRILAGNHTWAAARELGWSEIAVAWVDVDEPQAKRIMLVDNRASDMGRYDAETLSDLLQSLEGDFEGTGYDQVDLDGLLRSTATPDPGERPSPPPTVAPFTIVFDHSDQRTVWREHLKWMAEKYPDHPTIAARLIAFISEVKAQ